MNNLQILQAVKDQNGLSFTNLMTHFLSHPDRAPVADKQRIVTLIAAGYLRGETRANTAIHITPLGEVHLQELQEAENHRLAKENYDNETLKALQEENKQIRKLVDTLKADLHLEITKMKAAEKDSRFSKAIAIASFVISVLSLIFS